MHAIVIGSGIAGLATALRLRKKGFSVEIFEKNNYVGGKLTAFEQEGFRFDAGPSLFTLPKQVDELFELFGENPRTHFNYMKLDIACNYFWKDGTQLTASGNVDEFAKNVEKTLQTPASFVKRYLKKSAFVYNTVAPVFLHMSLHKWTNFINLKTLKGVILMPFLGIFSKLNSHNQQQFSNPKLVQLFNRYATYNGSNPYQAPAVLQSIPHLEFNIGAYLPENGMHDITVSLEALAKRQGIVFQLKANVSKIEINQNKAVGIWVNNILKPADIIVSNADVFPTYRNLLPEIKAPEKVMNQPRSSSALIFYWGINKEFAQLDVHNIFFSDDYKEEFNCIFEKQIVSKDPTIYINITSKKVVNDAPKGCENWFVMINVPGNTGQDWEEIIRNSRRNIIDKLNSILKEDISTLILNESILDPRTIESKTSSYQGSLYGSSSNNRNAAFQRQANFSSKLKGLYFCGGSVHPGGGIPLCLQSARIVADLIKNK
jgi:phytoene desaturase